MQVSSEQRMTPKLHPPISLFNNASGGAVGIVIALVLVLSLAGGGGYLAYNKYLKKAPLKTKLSTMKVKEELIQFTHDRVSTALYHNMVVLDDIVVMMDRERDRLKRIGKKFPNQNGIVASQTKELGIARERLAKVLAEVTANVEKMYVTWLVNRSEGAVQIRSQKGTLTRLLADAIRGEAVLVSRIRTNPDAAS
jgi:glycyl-tRNA synthetase beta subunit